MSQCPICLNQHTRLFSAKRVKRIKFLYHLCPNCFTLFLSPPPTPKSINHYYKNQFSYLLTKKQKERINQQAKKTVEQLKRLFPKGKTLLDIGSGYGFVLTEGRKKHLNCLGIEPSPRLYQLTKNKLPVLPLTIEQFLKKTPRKRFDYITIIQTIEHLFNPQLIIKKLGSLLNKRGVLYIETPNLDSYLFRSEQQNYTFLTPPDHIWLFSARSFHYLLQQEKELKVIKIQTSTLPEHTMGVIKSLVKPGLDSLKKKKLSVKKSANHPSSSFKSHFFKELKYLLIDRFIARLLTPFLNFNNKGTILQIYIRKT